MTITEPRDSAHPSDNLICPRCSSSLPPHAIFCSACGARIKKKKTEGEARTENGNDDAQGQEVVDTARLPSLSRVPSKGLRSYRSLKNNGMTRRIHKSSLLPVADIDTQK